MKYRMPAEWEPHEGTWIAWPHNKGHWPGKFDPIPGVFIEMITALTQGEKVFLLVNDERMERAARSLLETRGATMERVQFMRIKTDSSWTRDYGPIFVRNEHGELAVTGWNFNAWGEKYAPWDRDNAVPKNIAETLQLSFKATEVVLEGGTIEVNGKGSLIATEQCLLNANRNPQLTRKQIEQELEKYLGATNVLWLKQGMAGDDTDGHIDEIARFVNENTIVCPLETNPDDANYKILQENYRMLQHMRDQDGNPFTIVPLPQPAPVFYKGRQLLASYLNFYIANTVVLVPTFRCAQDENVLGTLQQFFPGRTVAGLDCTNLIWGLGAIHCSTQQQPVA
jgi:agmatine deiminase